MGCFATDSSVDAPAVQHGVVLSSVLSEGTPQRRLPPNWSLSCMPWNLTCSLSSSAPPCSFCMPSAAAASSAARSRSCSPASAAHHNLFSGTLPTRSRGSAHNMTLASWIYLIRLSTPGTCNEIIFCCSIGSSIPGHDSPVPASQHCLSCSQGAAIAASSPHCLRPDAAGSSASLTLHGCSPKGRASPNDDTTCCSEGGSASGYDNPVSAV